MLFKLEKPWEEWLIKTKVGKQTFSAKIDTGAYITLIGIGVAKCITYSTV
ncbi:MAG: hypothetical protein LBC73_05270 [Oscillospiraceae bacterium]|jgi:hypothetical protein|nr:hypothetical protein [Oscillospiraceae bacterium]